MPRIPRPLTRATALLGAAALLTGCTAPGAGTTGAAELQVFGASSTRVINDELSALAAELEPPHELTFNNDGSGTLVTQLHEGAPADVLITADEHSMNRAVADGSADDPQRLATNTMVMVVPAGNPAGIDSVDDLTDDDVDLVLCDPQVPCGDVAERLIEHSDLTVAPVSLEGAVGDVLGKVHNGEADAGWVYRTDALAAGDDVDVIDIPGAENTPTTLWVAAATASQNPERATALIELILSPDVAAILTDAGFTPAA
jgi:molybdate transport system substrate-binding protein